MRFSSPTIRTRLVAIVFAMVLPFGAAAVGTAVLTWRSGRAAIERDLQARATSLSLVVARELDVARAMLEALASSRTLDTGDLAGFYDVVQRMPRPDGARVVLSDASGQMLVNSVLPFGTPLPRRGDTGIVGRVFETGQAQVSDLYTGPITREPLVAIDVPVRRGGRVLYDLNMGLRPDALARVLEGQRPPGSAWVAAVLDSTGTIVARTPDMQTYAGRQATAEARLAMRAGTAGAFESPSVDGEPILAAYNRAPGSNWTAVVAVRQVGVQAELWRSLTGIATGGAALLVFGLAVALYQARRIARAIGGLATSGARTSGIREVEQAALAVAEAGSVRDRAVAALAGSEARLRRAQEAGGVHPFEIGPDGVARCDDALRGLFGAPPGAPLDHATWLTRLHPDDRARLEADFARLVREGGMTEIEYRIRPPDGPTRWLFSRAEALPGQEGRPGVITGVTLDVTERRLAEERLRESEAALRDVDAATDCIAVIDAEGRITFLNEPGRCQKEIDDLSAVLGQPVEALWPREAVPTVRSAMAEARAGTAARFTAFGPTAKGKPRWWDVTFSPLPGADGEAPRLLAVARDVTAAREAEQALRDGKDRLRVLNETLEERVREEVAAREATQARLVQAEKLAALGQLAGGIAHDFNNVMQAVGGGAALIRRRPANAASVERLAGMIEDATRRGASITQRLLAFSRRGELRAEAVDVAALLDGLREVLAHTLGAGVEIVVEVSAGLPPLLADRGQLETALVNLATNARDAMTGGGRLTFSASAERVADTAAELLPPGPYIRLLVEDTGTGMDAATLARAMEPFFTTKAVGKGTGLGLAMARGFAEQSGGALSVSSEPGRGTEVALWLPVTDTAADGRARVTAASVKDQVAGRILLVDDEDLVREVLAEELSDYGYGVAQAEGGATALALLDADEEVDLLVSDLSMPGLDGVALIREAQRRRPGLPAILLTGYAGDAATLAVDGAVRGSFTLLRKPVSAAQLNDRVATLLSAAGPR